MTPFFVVSLVPLSIGLSLLYLSPVPFWTAAGIVVSYLVATTWRKYK